MFVSGIQVEEPTLVTASLEGWVWVCVSVCVCVMVGVQRGHKLRTQVTILITFALAKTKFCDLNSSDFDAKES